MGDGVYNYAGYPQWATQPLNIMGLLLDNILYSSVNLYWKIIVSQHAGNPSKINSLAQFVAIDLKCIILDKACLICPYLTMFKMHNP